MGGAGSDQEASSTMGNEQNEAEIRNQNVPREEEITQPVENPTWQAL